MGTNNIQRYKRILSGALVCLMMLILIVGIETFFICTRSLSGQSPVADAAVPPSPAAWQPPSMASIPAGENGISILYGQILVRETARFLGPKGSVMQITNGMNCQNCHLQAGTKPFGNNYSATAVSYPKFRSRSNGIETLNKRISDCFERSLNGEAPDSNGREMTAIRHYIEWVGSDVHRDQQLEGSGIRKPAYLNRAADPAKGAKIYTQKCQSCHGANGEGVQQADGIAYTYPPLWGEHSYNDGAGLYRLSNFAGYVKYNMPFGVDYTAPQLSDEEAWDVAAFINSQPRPHKDQSADWKNLKKKPVDFPFGPYADAFSEQQHKYGPFKPMQQ